MPPNLSVEEAEALRALARNYVEGRRWACRLWRMLAWIGGMVLFISGMVTAWHNLSPFLRMGRS